MDDVIQQLERRLHSLVQTCEHLKELNLELNQTQRSLIQENELLWAKHQHAIHQMEALVSRLKSIENPQ